MTIITKSNYAYAADMKAAGAQIKIANTFADLQTAAFTALFAADDKHKMRLVLGGIPIDEVKSGSLLISIDSAARGWTAVCSYDPDNPLRYNLFKPFQYTPAEIFIGGKLVCRGYHYTSAPSITESGRYITLKGWSPAADPIDSTMFPPYEYNLMTLRMIANSLMVPYGITVVWQGGVDKPFKRATSSKTEKIMDFLLNLAHQRKKLIMSDEKGQLVIHEVGLGFPCATIGEGSLFNPAKDFSTEFDGRKMFGSYTAYSSSPKRNKNATAFDNAVLVSRHTAVTAGESDDMDMATSAQMAAQKALADAYTFNFPEHSWYTDDILMMSLWEPNTIVRVESPTLFLPSGFDFLIRSVEYKFDADGTRADLGIVPPQVYTGLPLEVW